MIKLESAIDFALAFASKEFNLSDEGDEVRVIVEKTLEFNTGWVFFYNSARFLDSGDFAFMLLSNKPIFVEKGSGRQRYLRTDIPFSEQVE